MISGIVTFFRKDGILQSANAGVIHDAISLIAIIIQQCGQNHVHGCAVSDAVKNIQIEAALPPANRPYMKVRLFTVETDPFFRMK